MSHYIVSQAHFPHITFQVFLIQTKRKKSFILGLRVTISFYFQLTVFYMIRFTKFAYIWRVLVEQPNHNRINNAKLKLKYFCHLIGLKKMLTNQMS